MENSSLDNQALPPRRWVLVIDQIEEPYPQGLMYELHRIGREIGSGAYPTLVENGSIHEVDTNGGVYQIDGSGDVIDVTERVIFP